ncbi:MAG: metal-dependent hydrolase [Pseudomonadales bacterium]|jgi:inner membrane protein|nr:metal-dependent hydrolase [Pseudomonadales bacterium]
MENISHSLFGAALAGATLPRDRSPLRRRVFYITGLLAANLPDLDLIYTRLTPPPLGYLLHHRGHTHTIVGLVALAVVPWLITLIPRVRKEIGDALGRYWLLVALALASHLLADGWNSYGIHPFYPLSNQWLYGDAVFILEPWFWTLLGVAVVLNIRYWRGRWLLAALLGTLPLIGLAIGLFPWPAVALLAAVGGVFILLLRPLDEARRSVIALVATGVFVLLSFNLNEAAVRQIRRADPDAAARTVDLILNPRPANPLCWDALRLTHEPDDTLLISQKSIPLPSAASPACGANTSLAWTTLARQPLAELRQLASENCSVNAWLQFARAPVISEGNISDLRFGNSLRGNFTTLRLDAAAAECPPYLTKWTPPRSDVLGD